MMLDTILIVGAALSVFLIVVGIYQAFFNPRLAVINRLGKATADVGGPAERVGRKHGLRKDFLWVLGKLGRIVPRRVRLEEIQANLITANVFMRAEEFVGLILMVGVSVYVVFYLLTKSVLIGFFAGLVSLFIPGIVINAKKSKRMLAITNQLPEALNIISSGLRAGFSFPQAVSIVVREMQPPLAFEFSKVLRENRIGKPMDDALNDLLDRIENDDLELLVTALLIQRQVGGNLAEVLDGISHTIRERVRIKGEIRTLTAEGRLSAIVLISVPLVVAGAILLLNPGYIIPLIQEPVGLIMIASAVILQIIGIFFIRKIINIDI